MRIFYGEQELDIPQWINVTQNSMNVTPQTTKVNDAFGEQLTGGEYFSSRTFKCSGTIAAVQYNEVEKLRSHLTDMLSSKVLRLYRDDTDEIFYECVLDGTINTGYYQGKHIARAITVDFTLKALFPFARSAQKTYQKGVSETSSTITLGGNYQCYPLFHLSVSANKNLSGVLLECNSRKLELKKTLSLTTNETLSFNEQGLYKINNTTQTIENASDYLTEQSIVKPIVFYVGSNVLQYYHEQVTTFYNDFYK